MNNTIKNIEVHSQTQTQTQTQTKKNKYIIFTYFFYK